MTAVDQTARQGLFGRTPDCLGKRHVLRQIHKPDCMGAGCLLILGLVLAVIYPPLILGPGAALLIFGLVLRWLASKAGSPHQAAFGAMPPVEEARQSQWKRTVAVMQASYTG